MYRKNKREYIEITLKDLDGWTSVRLARLLYEIEIDLNYYLNRLLILYQEKDPIIKKIRQVLRNIKKIKKEIYSNYEKDEFYSKILINFTR